MSLERRSRCENQALREQYREKTVNNFLGKYGLLGINPREVGRKQRPNFQLAHLNWRLLKKGYQSVSCDQWEGLLNEVKRVPRKDEFILLEDNGLLMRSPNYHI